MNQEKKKRLAPKIKEILKRHGVKGTLSVSNYSTLNLNITEGPIKFNFTNNSITLAKIPIRKLFF